MLEQRSKFILFNFFSDIPSGNLYIGKIGIMGIVVHMMAIPGNDKKVYCSFYKSEICVHYTDLVSYAKTMKHKKNEALFSNV